MGDIKNLKALASGFSVLYIEDNKALRKNASKLLSKFFDTLHVGVDGDDGLKLFKEYHPDIVITDIKMPNVDGMELSKQIKEINPFSKIIIMSAFDDKEHLLQAIELDIFRFLKKPVNINELVDVLLATLKQIRHENNNKLFNMHLRSIFDYQSSMVLMLKDKKPLMANQMFLNFFDVENITNFSKTHADFGEEFLEHSGFLYNTPEKSWFDVLVQEKQNIYHVKLKDKNNEIKHFILKYKVIPEKESYSILSFDDVTDLEFIKLFNDNKSNKDEFLKDKTAMYDLLKVIYRNAAKIQLHNYYKGLSITNDAIIDEVKEDSIVLKTNFLQEKAVQYERNTIIVSDALPNIIVCDELENISFEEQTVEFKNIHFSTSSAVDRKTIRVVPEDTHEVTLIFQNHKFQDELRIADISQDAINIRLEVLPAGLSIGDEILVDMLLHVDDKPLIINIKSKLFRKKENLHSFSLVLTFDETNNKELREYITKRQMAIIREFKGLQNG